MLKEAKIEKIIQLKPLMRQILNLSETYCRLDKFEKYPLYSNCNNYIARGAINQRLRGEPQVLDPRT
jgi:hypothetical protein